VPKHSLNNVLNVNEVAHLLTVTPNVKDFNPG
jgi:hypothetical protein